MSFACPHFRNDDDHCLRMKTDCVPGRRGCVLEGKAVFAVPAEVRVRQREQERRRRAEAWPAEPPAGPAGAEAGGRRSPGA